MIGRIIICVVLFSVSGTAFSQVSDKEKFEHIEGFEKNFKKEKYKKAAKSFEWLFNTASYNDRYFLQNGILLYDYLSANESNDGRRKHYRNMLDTLKSLTDKELEEVLEERFEDHGYPQEPEDLKPVVTVVPDVEPEYPDGLEAFHAYISEQIEFPKILQKYGTTSKAFVAFVIDRDGRVINVKMLKGITEEVDQKITRVVKNSPDWIPGRKDGEPVPVRMVLPISFGYK